MPIKPETQKIIDRLCAIDWSAPKHDIDKVKWAYRKRYGSRGSVRTIHWVEDPKDFDPWILRQSERPQPFSALSSLIDPARTFFRYDQVPKLRNVCIGDWDFWTAWQSHAAWGASRVGYHGRLLSKNVSRANEVTHVTLPGWQASVAASILNLSSENKQKFSSKSLHGLAKLCGYMLDAYEAGAFAHIWLEKEIRILASPAIYVDDEFQIHRDDGPALEWPKSKVYAWHGTQVPKWVVIHPEKINLQKIRNQRRAEVRRVMLERHGYERYISQIPIIHQDETGSLRRCCNAAGANAGVVEVVNGTMEADGTRKRHFLSVPPECETATEAVAWTYGLDKTEYKRLSKRT